ncbi:hypothetical protein CF70_031045 [Cupriavidus sp. SK-3]|uniref:ClbS/DfsB family four-helix bundle protein n=1 Tax=Cupriavidus TaxID=106589 RepID=UPI0004450B3A|nr:MULTISPECIES: ClbS/DfsB family four-helix bundle protein [Cupriavidus]KDP88331.1 hypothetical protein CF70_031045 [Cupriavidus sp. SK-3]MDF3885648.1 ClbS/DfsB family four-helix bundle protein [Cupriavidus basilensis]
MAIPANREELLKAMQSTYARLAAELQAVPAARASEQTMEGHAGGTRMSVCDLVSYLIGWNTLVLRWTSRRAQGLEVDFPETGFKWNELGKLAQKFYADYAGHSYPALLHMLADANAGIVALVTALDDASLYGEPWYGKYTLGRMIQLNTSSPYENARGRLRKWRSAQPGQASAAPQR